MKRSLINVAVVLLACAGCSAPESRPATGPVADEVRAALASGSGGFDHAALDELLANGTRDGLVDYRYFQDHRADLDGYLGRIGEADLPALAPDELKALLINAYNAITIASILDHPAVSTIREIDGVWSSTTHLVGGHDLTLDAIEHNLLRPFFRDPRIHFAVNCASMSCAPLPPWAFEASRLDDQLEERSRAFLTDPANVQLEDGTLVVSRYFEWYGEDFVAEGWAPRAETIAGFIAVYGRPEIAAHVEAVPDVALRFMEYDWSLNSAVPPDPGVAGTSSDQAEMGGWAGRLRAWVSGLGPVAPLAYAAGYVLATLLLVPGGALTIGAGVAFGLVLGTVVVVVASNVGAGLAFLIARYLLRDRVERWLEGRARLSAVDRAVETQGWKVVALTRLSPIFPFNVQNYFYGLTGVTFREYMLAGVVAMFPGTLLYVYIGVAGTEVAAALTGAAGWGRAALQVAGLLATLLAVIVVTRVARKELERITADTNPGEPDPPRTATSDSIPDPVATPSSEPA